MGAGEKKKKRKEGDGKGFVRDYGRTLILPAASVENMVFSTFNSVLPGVVSGDRLLTSHTNVTENSAAN